MYPRDAHRDQHNQDDKRKSEYYLRPAQRIDFGIRAGIVIHALIQIHQTKSHELLGA